ncbi:MAG: A24 family peptidase [Eubacteriales bacterium]|nr:A24 family peptidase [Eubacteriales bacterium]
MYDISIWEYLLKAIFLCILTRIVWIDYHTKRIPNSAVLTVAAVGAVDMLLCPEMLFMERILGMFVVSVPMLGLTLAAPGAFGGGDIKLTAAAGLMLGVRLNLLAGVLAILIGGVYVIGLLLGKKIGRKGRIAFGPFLGLGMAVALLWGDQILAW